MRYQELIYDRGGDGLTRNRVTSNVNMSSDISVFKTPIYNMLGASKIDCDLSSNDNVYINEGDTIPMEFIFVENIDSFTNNLASFRYEIYKYKENISGFSSSAVYKSEVFEYLSFSGTNSISELIPINKLETDGEYIIKGYYSFSNSNNFLKKIGKHVDTFKYIYGDEYGLYNKNHDYYFVVLNKAERPSFTQNFSDSQNVGGLTQQTFIPENGQTIFNLATGVNGDFIVTLNGLVLISEDYSVNGSVITLSGETYSDDIVTIIYSSVSGFNLINDTIIVDSEIIIGPTDNQGDELIYFNNTTNKYEIYTSVNPMGLTIVMINGMTLAENIDYYASTTNVRRIILEGNIIIGDVITVVFYPSTGISNGVSTSSPILTWKIETPPNKNNGIFYVEVSEDKNFNSIYYSGNTNYIIGVNYYSHNLTLNGSIGTKLYYRVTNEKNYVTICGETVISSEISETIPIIIQSNSINSY